MGLSLVNIQESHTHDSCHIEQKRVFPYDAGIRAI